MGRQLSFEQRYKITEWIKEHENEVRSSYLKDLADPIEADTGISCTESNLRSCLSVTGIKTKKLRRPGPERRRDEFYCDLMIVTKAVRELANEWGYKPRVDLTEVIGRHAGLSQPEILSLLADSILDMAAQSGFITLSNDTALKSLVLESDRNGSLT